MSFYKKNPFLELLENPALLRPRSNLTKGLAMLEYQSREESLLLLILIPSIWSITDNLHAKYKHYQEFLLIHRNESVNIFREF